MPPALQVEQLAKAYGDLQALDHVTFQAEAGSCTVLLGPNGAGKSTLMAILATLREPDAGTARVGGADVVTDPGAARRALGIAFQEPMVSKHLTAREVLTHHAALYGLSRARRDAKADELLTFVDLADRADDHVSDFSGGMKRRLDLARVLMTDPQVLLLDEPTAGLDVRGQQDVRAKIQTLVEEGTTVLLATHDLREAQALADQVVILDKGHIVAADTPSRLARRLGHRVVRVALPEDASEARHEEVDHLLADMGQVVTTRDGVELMLGPSATQAATSITPGQVVDRLEQAGLEGLEVTVRDPDLGDVFLELTGHSLTASEAVGGDA
ncbi:MAG: ABC transporter ATP-binding protein [Candidatus Thermoplasmatota archaeon]|nr:ABC transporter ATP-binding protein [Candidatus Thermoplasmatota archaeon]